MSIETTFIDAGIFFFFSEMKTKEIQMKEYIFVLLFLESDSRQQRIYCEARLNGLKTTACSRSVSPSNLNAERHLMCIVQA